VTEDNENLTELVSRFFDENRTHEIAEDIRAGEELLATFSAPAADQAVINSIKTQIKVHLETRKRQKGARTIFYRAAVAAAIVVLAIAGARHLVGPNHTTTYIADTAEASIWDDETGLGADEQLATLTAQVSEIEADILAVRLGEDTDKGSSVLTDLEAEMSEINGDFWKG
jgi:hypothetical protein